jgi:hypothetical protein
VPTGENQTLADSYPYAGMIRIRFKGSTCQLVSQAESATP